MSRKDWDMKVVFCLSFIAVILLWVVLLGIFISTVRAYRRINKDFKQAFFFDEKVKGLTANQIAHAKDECYIDVIGCGWSLVVSSIAVASMICVVYVF